MPSTPPSTVVVLGTGGTIAGTAASPADHLGYRSGTVPVADLLHGIDAPAGVRLESEQVAQIDSKDMDFALWRRLAERIQQHLARAEVLAVVVTHGTDTMEETAYFLHRVLAPHKPVVLTGAMRPATSSEADGPRNLADAIAVASQAGLERRSGVVVAFAGSVFAAADVRKMHPARRDAFGAGDAGPVGRIEAGRLRHLRAWPHGEAIGLAALPARPADWPFVAVVASGAGVDAGQVRALTAAGCRGIVVACTGNGSLHRELESALRQAIASGVSVLRSTRCIEGGIVESEERAREGLPSAGTLTPPQARVELIVRLLDAGCSA